MDIIVIGAGPAGISAAIYAKSRGLDVLVIEKNRVGGIIGNVSTVTHYSAIVENETGESFAKRMKKQAEGAGVDIIYENVIEVSLIDDIKTIKTETHTYESKAVIIANGSTPRQLGIPGEIELAGNGIGLNAARDGIKYKDKNIYVVGGADGAIKEAIYLAQYAKKLTIIHFENKLSAIAEFVDKIGKLDNVEVMLESRLIEVRGKGQVDELIIENVNDKSQTAISDDGCGVFVYAGLVPNSELFSELDSENGYIYVNAKMETDIKGVYAAGDITVKQIRQAATAVADGAIAGINASAYVLSL